MHGKLWKPSLLVWAALSAPPATIAAEPVTAPPVLEAPRPGLPPLRAPERTSNPYRGQAQVLAAGGAAYQQHCASCHGESASRPVAEGPDLRRLDTFCRKLVATALRDRCLDDVDGYFLHSVLEGKLRAGLMHMPAWKGVLPRETIWAIRSFTAAQPLPPPRTLPDLPREGVVPTAAETRR